MENKNKINEYIKVAILFILAFFGGVALGLAWKLYGEPGYGLGVAGATISGLYIFVRCGYKGVTALLGLINPEKPE